MSLCSSQKSFFKGCLSILPLAKLLVYIAIQPSIPALASHPFGTDPLIVDYFYSPGCPDCQRIDLNVLPVIRETYQDLVDLRRWNIHQPNDVIRLIAYQDALSITENHPVLMVVDYKTVLNGIEAIESAIFETLQIALESRLNATFVQTEPIFVPDLTEGMQQAGQRLQRFTWPTILLAGLIDGLNPCAMTALAFLMSLLAVANVRGARLLLLGIPYCLAAFLTYFILGLGLMQFFYYFHGIQFLRSTLQIVIIGGLLLASFLSFRDAWRFQKTGDAHAVTLRLPRRMMLFMHTIMRKGVRSRFLILGGFTTGAAVTVLDSICTGQLYIPTLTLMIQSSDGAISRKAIGYLLAYNGMFILPITSIFLLIWLGMQNQLLLDWTRRHVVTGKILLGMLMLLIAAILTLFTR